MKKYDICILLAGVCWGMIGIFTRNLGLLGLKSGGVLIVRSGGCAVLFLLSALIRDRASLRIERKNVWLLCLFGALTFFFTYCYYNSIANGSLSAACVLMYSAPVFVMIASLFLFKEKFTVKKLAALLAAMAGCIFVSGILEDNTSGSMAGTVFGLLAGIGYASYSVCIKALSNRGVKTLTINVYGWIITTALGIIVFHPSSVEPAFSSVGGWALSIGMIVIAGFLPALLYSYGLSGEEAGKGAVLATTEPVTASIMGLFFHEIPSLLSIIGIILVLSAVILLNINIKPFAQSKSDTD